MYFHQTHAALLALVLSSSLSTCAFAAAASFEVLSNNTNTSAQTLGSANTGIVDTNATLSVSGSTVAVTITGNSTITNNGTILQTGTARAIYDNTANTILTVNNNTGALIQTADADVIQMNKASSSIIFNNYGTLTSLNASAGGAQAIDFNAITSGSNTLNNYAGGIIQASEADAVRPGKNGFVYNDGTIKSTTATGSSSDGIDAQTNSGITIVNASAINGDTTNTGLIEGARHGITGGDTSGAVYVMSITNNVGGIIQGDNGAGINIDGINANEVVTILNHGTITGNGVSGDGDGVDVDGIVNLTNDGIIKSLHAYNETSEGVTVGGGTIINYGTIEGSNSVTNADDTINTGVSHGITLAGVDKDINDNPIPVQGIYTDTVVTNYGLIKGDNGAGIAVTGAQSVFALTVNNEVGGVIEGGGLEAGISSISQTMSINNYGTITNASTATVAAINLGSGNDILMNYGTIIGLNAMAINMGDGNDTVALLGGHVVGSIDGGNGINTLILGNSQTYKSNNTIDANRISNFQSLTTQGSGVILEVAVKDTVTPLPFNQTVILSNGTTIKPVVSGKIVDGSYNIISAVSLTADVSQLNVIDTSAMLDFSLSQSNNDLNLIITQTKQFHDLTSSNLSGLGYALNRLNSSADSEQLISTLNSFSTYKEVNAAIKQLSPDISNAALSASLSAQGTLFNTLLGRMSKTSFGASGISAGDDTAGHGWLEILGSTAKQGSRDGADGYAIDTAGFALGYEDDINSKSFWGVTGGYTHAKTNGTDASQGDSTDIESFHAGVYYSLNTDDFRINSALVGSYNKYSGDRYTDISGLNENLLSTYGGHAFGAMLEAGYPILLKEGWNIKPLIGGQYSYNVTNAYDEQGGSLALHVDSTTSSSVKSVIGSEFTKAINPTANYTIDVRYLHDFASAPTTTAGFISEGSTFSVNGVTPPRDALQLGLSYKILTNNGTVFSAGYDAEIKDQYISHQFTFKALF